MGIRLINLWFDLRSAKRSIPILGGFRPLDTRHPLYRELPAGWNGREADIREKLAAHGLWLQLLLNGQDVATRSTIERDTEASSLSLSALNVQSNETRKDAPTGRRNASKRIFPENGLPSDNRLPNDNITEGDVDTPSKANGRLHPSNEDIPRSAEKVYPSFRHFYNDTDAFMTSFSSFTSVESVARVTHDATVALVTCDGKQLPPLSGAYPHDDYALRHFQKETNWTRAQDSTELCWTGPTPKYTSYSLEFSLEEVFSGAVRHIDVQRTMIYSKHRHAAPVRNISFNVKADRGLRNYEIMEYFEAGNHNADNIESLIFILKRVSIWHT